MKLLRLIRLQNIIIISITQILTYFCLVLNHFTLHFDYSVFAIIAGTLLIASAGNIINDYYDVEIDKINRPGWNVLEDSKLRRKSAYFYLILNVVALLIGYYLGEAILIIYAISIVTLWSYSRYFKRILLVGNAIIALLMACSIIIVWIYFRSSEIYLVVIYTAFAFLSGLIRELIKDIEDIEGDALKGLKTFPIVYGIDRARWLVVVLLVFMLGSLALFIIKNHEWVGWLMRIYLGMVVFIPTFLMIFLVRDAKEKVDYSKLSYRIKMIMVLGITSMLFLIL